jgi:peptidoglycan L-alanyl-D-glutamate endopeptidase CwlK
MPKFSAKSLGRLESCDPKLQLLFNEVIKGYDCTILCGHRGKDDQDLAVKSGHSKAAWPNSKHNSFPSLAVDVAPSPLDWSDTDRFYHFAGYVLATANSLGIKIRWGGNWRGDFKFRDEKFQDMPHVELVE